VHGHDGVEYVGVESEQVGSDDQTISEHALALQVMNDGSHLEQYGGSH